MELRHLRYFLAVADAGTTTRAAARLRVAQQAVSKQLTEMERELGVALFVRHPRGMALTRAGEEFARHARDVLAQHARAVEHVRRLGTDRQVLRVGLFDYGAGLRVALAAVTAFRRALPHVDVAVSPLPTARQAAAVACAQLDAGFAIGHAPDGPEAAGLAAERLLEEPITHVLLPAAHPLAARPAVEAADLAALGALGYGADALPRFVEEEYALMRAAGWSGRLAVEVEYAPQIFPMVAAGAGWATGPASFGPEAPSGTRYVPLATGGGTPMDVYAVTRAGEAAPGADPLAAAFRECLREARAELTAAPSA